jgi:hypothetical protein
MLRRMTLVRTNVSEERIATINMVTRIGELGTSLGIRLIVNINVAPSSLILITLMMEAIRSSECLVLTRAILCYIPEDGRLHNVMKFSESWMKTYQNTRCYVAENISF